MDFNSSQAVTNTDVDYETQYQKKKDELNVLGYQVRVQQKGKAVEAQKRDNIFLQVQLDMLEKRLINGTNNRDQLIRECNGITEAFTGKEDYLKTKVVNSNGDDELADAIRRQVSYEGEKQWLSSKKQELLDEEVGIGILESKITDISKDIAKLGALEQDLKNELDDLTAEKLRFNEKWGQKTNEQVIKELKTEVQLLRNVGVEHRTEKELLQPFHDVGTQIRLRFLEHQVPKIYRDTSVVWEANCAAHWGNCVADAILINVRAAAQQTQTYAKPFWHTYGFWPHHVFLLRNVTKFVDILNWRAAVKNVFQGIQHRHNGWKDERFGFLWRGLFNKSPLANYTEDNRYHSTLEHDKIQEMINFLDTDEIHRGYYVRLKNEFNQIQATEMARRQLGGEGFQIGSG